jgi:hypothetical protein
MIAKGEQMRDEGKQLLMESETRVGGRDQMWEASTMMMQGKNHIMDALEKNDALKTERLMDAWRTIVEGEHEMMTGKNLMLKGRRMFK